MKCSTKVAAGIGTTVAIVICILFIIPAKNYRVGDLIVTLPSGTRLPGGLRRSDWHTVKVSENELIFKIVVLEPVVRRSEFITHELISVSHHVGTGVVPSIEDIQYLSKGKSQVSSVLGLMLQRFLREGFEIGEGSSFTKIAGADAYRFELVKREVPIGQWLKGEHTQYAWYIVVWKGDWYLITYSNFDDARPGAHFSDFGLFLEELKFVNH